MSARNGERYGTRRWLRWAIGASGGIIPYLAANAQGDLQHLRNEPYLQGYYEHPVDLDSIPNDGSVTFYDRVRANLQLQEADSVLRTVHDQLRVRIIALHDDTLLRTFDDLQAAWRAYRDAHCRSTYGGYVTTTGAVMFMNEVRRLTELRTEEMRALLEAYPR
ncbi:MAG: DUF1311 domain-containing protein [Flavobacteriales bacterium]|nr:DUF1311 domain-containing protein [Flavobacteriales bacterium]MCB9168650.1 DUF1311 domain-containing protein [Flavobacteriales bacterium]